MSVDSRRRRGTFEVLVVHSSLRRSLLTMVVDPSTFGFFEVRVTEMLLASSSTFRRLKVLSVKSMDPLEFQQGIRRQAECYKRSVFGDIGAIIRLASVDREDRE